MRRAIGMILGAIALVLLPAAASAQAGFVWSYDAFQDSQGRRILVLSYSIPQSDAAQFSAICAVEQGRAFAKVQIAAAIGSLRDGDPLRIRFQAPSVNVVMTGTAVGVGGEALVGAAMSVELDDPLWDAIRHQSQLSYRVIGFGSQTLGLSGSGTPTARFIGACGQMAQGNGFGNGQGGNGQGGNGQGGGQFGNGQGGNGQGGNGQGGGQFGNGQGGNGQGGGQFGNGQGGNGQGGNGQGGGQPPGPVPGVNPGQSISCTSFGIIRTVHTGPAATVTMVNDSDGYRSVFWIDAQGAPKHYADLNQGQSFVQQTAAGHVWMVTDGPGNCLEMYVPPPGTSTYHITAPGQPFGQE